MNDADHYHAQWRMAASAAALARRTFLTLGIPHPDRVIFQEYGEKATDSEGAELRRGFARLQLVWENMNRRDAATLRDEIEAGLSAGYLFLTIDRAVGKAPGPDWVDVKGKPYTPDLAALARSYGQAYDQVGLQLLAVEVVNEPSSYAP